MRICFLQLLNKKVANDILYDLQNNSRLQPEVFETASLSTDGRWKVYNVYPTKMNILLVYV